MNKVCCIPVLLLFFLAVSSCCKKRIYCGSAQLNFSFTGFKRGEVRSFVLRRYAVGGQWGKALDSATFVYSGTAAETAPRDTVQFSDYNTVGDLSGITAGNDWSIYFPAIAKTFYITTIFEEENRYEMVKCGDDEAKCSKNINNFSINDAWQYGGYAHLDKDLLQ